MSAYPLQLAIRLVLDDIAYSNPLPDWHTPLRIDYTERERRIVRRVEQYLAETASPRPAFSVQVPHRSGRLRTWKLPVVNDQIILQACVSLLSEKLRSRINWRWVYSYRPSEDPNHLALARNQLESWLAFQAETLSLLKERQYILQLDLRQAFPSIDRGKLYQFLQGLEPEDDVMFLLRLLIESFSGGDPGVPLVNDTLFLLGNAYLTVVDDIVGKETEDFIRFMDDYRIFSSSEDELKATFERINGSLQAAGFAVNDAKLKLGSRDDYLAAFPKRDAAEAAGSYISIVLGEIMDPEQVVILIVKTLREPEKYLHEGFGRFLLGALRRFRYQSAVARKLEIDAVDDTLKDSLERDPDAIPLAVGLLRKYARDPLQVWRTVWLIYLLEHVTPTEEIVGLLRDIEARAETPAVVRLWARRCREGRKPEREILPEDLHDLGYLEAGQRCYGDQPCEDATS